MESTNIFFPKILNKKLRNKNVTYSGPTFIKYKTLEGETSISFVPTYDEKHLIFLKACYQENWLRNPSEKKKKTITDNRRISLSKLLKDRSNIEINTIQIEERLTKEEKCTHVGRGVD